jgi:hypothetical protein
LKHSLFFLLCVLSAACGRGADQTIHTAAQKSMEAPPATSPPPPQAPAPKQSGRGLAYEFLFSNAEATFFVCTDGPFALIDETWKPSGKTGGKPWGADKSRIIFDSANKTLTVINLSKNTFVRLDEKRMSETRDKLENGTPVSLGNLGAQASSAMGVLPPLSAPLPYESPKKKHPEGCAVFARDLPQGLKEETCFAEFDDALPVSEAFSPLVSLASFVQGLDQRVPELEIAAAVATAMEWDAGLPAAQFKFGDSPFEEDNADMEAWDRTLILKERRPCTVSSADLDPPEDATEAFTLLPWSTPFLVTALPK